MNKVKLWEKNTPYFCTEYGQEEPTLVPYLLQDGKTHPCIIVFAGGGYDHRAYHEGEPVAQWLNTIGFHAFVLEYRLRPYTHDAMVSDAVRSVRLVRYRAEAFGIDPNKIGVLGFSAGGHLAYMTALRYKDGSVNPEDPTDSVSGRPDFAVACYAVASFEKFAHMGTAECFLGEGFTTLDLHTFSAEQNVTPDTPPMFLWHTAGDEVVPVENSLNMAKALRANRVPFSLHIYPNGGHGLGLAADIPLTSNWTKDLKAWLSEILEMEA